jgi:hypothetical protein
LTVEITLNGKRTNLTNIYRSPSHWITWRPTNKLPIS